jgi:hypothetical protein
MDAAQVTAWIAFGDARSFDQWDAFAADKLSRSWAEWGLLFGITGMLGPAHTLLAALESRAKGKAWRGPTGEFGGTWKWGYRAQVRKLMRRSGVSAAVLASQLKQDIATQTEIDKRLEEARKKWVGAIRNKVMHVFGHRAHADGKSDPSAIAEKIDFRLLLGPRTISYDGWLRADVNRELKEWVGYTGPFFDRVHVRTSDALTLRPLDRATNPEPPQGIPEPDLDRAANLEPPQGIPVPQPNLGGRPPKWNWLAFDAEVVRIANTPDGLPERHELNSLMLDWCMTEWKDTPAESAVRDRIAHLYPE